ncbi:hypothetical protein [Rhodococcus koreensis]
MSTPTAKITTPIHTGPRTGSISTAEIKARIEAMFPDDRSRPTPS